MKKRTKSEEPRIYVLLPETVQYEVRGKVHSRRMVAGRLMAQVGHVVSLMRTEPEILQEYRRQMITTITLSVRNSRELQKLSHELFMNGILSWECRDENRKFYGTTARITTALCTKPVTEDEVVDILGHLERYGKGDD